MANQAIWKFPVIGSEAKIAMPRGAEILSAQMQDNVVMLWAIVSPENPVEERMVRVFMTGEPFVEDLDMEFIDTVQAGPYVLHVFELT